MTTLLRTAVGITALGLSLQANALNILLTNDDGCRAPASKPSTRRWSLLATR